MAGAFSPGSSIASLSVVPFGDGVTLAHFRYLFESTNYLLWYRNTLIIAVFSSAGTVVIASLGAYVFSRFRFPLKKSMMMALLILQIFPSFIGMIAIYVILLRIGGIDTLWGLVLVYVAGNIPYNVWLVKSYLDTIPRKMCIRDSVRTMVTRIYWIRGTLLWETEEYACVELQGFVIT